ncbi:Olfactory receptor 1E1 [Sciurus carolinensis]|uniref:Olfactory receptor 1E1 n=1 Tax=Sciurus carolinensis TaxID=30640 RepID=A0AA41SVY9_SCICA|nr:Olfactory receptor 1E1 [Sciurus carolinensis]
MRRENQSSVSEFLLLGLPIQPEEQGMYYALFLAMYLTTVLGNLLIILLIRLDSHLHTPMYFFLSHLALTDICFSSVTAPKMLMDMLMQTQSISYTGDNTLPYFFCDLSAFLKLSSSDTTINQLVILTARVVVITLPSMCILVSYGHIGVSVLRRPSIKGICKALSTCGSHLSVVSLYYGAIIALYFVSSSSSNKDKDVTVSVLYTVVTTMLNPFIYSLRNRDIKRA